MTAGNTVEEPAAPGASSIVRQAVDAAEASMLRRDGLQSTVY